MCFENIIGCILWLSIKTIRAIKVAPDDSIFIKDTKSKTGI